MPYCEIPSAGISGMRNIYNSEIYILYFFQLCKCLMRIIFTGVKFEDFNGYFSFDLLKNFNDDEPAVLL
jgi:hypothetical protein